MDGITEGESMEHHDQFRSPIKFELAVTLIVKPITINLVTNQANAAELAALTKDIKEHTGALKQALTQPKPEAG